MSQEHSDSEAKFFEELGGIDVDEEEWDQVSDQPEEVLSVMDSASSEASPGTQSRADTPPAGPPPAPGAAPAGGPNKGPQPGAGAAAPKAPAAAGGGTSAGAAAPPRLTTPAAPAARPAATAPPPAAAKPAAARPGVAATPPARPAAAGQPTRPAGAPPARQAAPQPAPPRPPPAAASGSATAAPKAGPAAPGPAARRPQQPPAAAAATVRPAAPPAAAAGPRPESKQPQQAAASSTHSPAAQPEAKPAQAAAPAGPKATLAPSARPAAPQPRVPGGKPAVPAAAAAQQKQKGAPAAQGSERAAMTKAAAPAARPAAVPAQEEMESRADEGMEQSASSSAAAGVSSAGGGWSGWGAFGKLGATLQTAAATALHDVTELTESFTQALAEAAEGESDDEPRLAVVRRPAEPEGELAPEVAAKRAEVLQRLEGAGGKSGELGADHLAAGAGRALSSVWGWGAQLASKVEAAAASAARELAGADEPQLAAAGEQGGAPEGSDSEDDHSVHEFRLGASLLTLGRTAQQLLAGPGRGGAGAGGGGAPTSFEQAFYIYGGRQAVEELEALSGDCARTCNRLRAQLPEADAGTLDAVLRSLAPLFDARERHDVDAAPPTPARALAQGHGVVQDLAAAGCEKAAALSQPASKPAKPAPPAAAGEEGASEREAAAAAAAAAQGQLEQLRTEGATRVAEVCSLCMERLLALGRSLVAQYKYGRPADDGIVWPPSPEASGALLRGQAQRMLSDVARVADAFAAALRGAAQCLDDGVPSKPAASAAQPLLAGLKADAGLAADRVHDAFHSLMHVAWMTSLDRGLLE